MAYSTIPKGSLYMDTKLYTGNNSSLNTISGIPFAPDLIWIKARGAATDHVLFDKVRGVYKSLSSNDDTVENNNPNQLQTFTSDGWTMGDLNTSNAATTFASWNWKANGAGSANTDGDIASTVSVNSTAGFSICSWTGNGNSGQSVGHGLGLVPKIMFVKNLNSAQVWRVYVLSLGSDNGMILNTTSTAGVDSSLWNNSTASSSIFYLGSSSSTNGNGNSMIAYIFSDIKGFSKMGSYVGNGNADGTFIYTGFKPAFVITKGTANISSWSMTDSTISTFNDGSLEFLKANEADAESSRSNYDILSNGFKMRTTDADYNGSGNNYIYMAFAENPLVANSGTDGVPATAR